MKDQDHVQEYIRTLFTKDIIQKTGQTVSKQQSIRYTRLFSPKAAFRSRAGQGRVVNKKFYSDFIKDKAKLPIH